MEEAKRGPKRRQGVEGGLIVKASAREVTFSKRHQGLFRKAAELSILCGAEVAVITYSPHGNPFAFAHPSIPDALIDRYLSSGATGPAADEAAAAVHRKQHDDAVAKLEEAKREAERIAAEAGGKRNRWWEEAVGDGVEEEELEHYVASLESLKKLVAERVGQYDDLGFYGRLLATDKDISMDLDATFLAELQYSC
ncbi:agamous-like MADS-box protein AGL61 [Eucalyptus grandis]|uniref:agamous-like MADS-box protein AGL61 n=1 Tax=Eucalyptus grandis TaxID=71139 RepID=UPI00192E78E5|nr:agamous-like MADS-box protein AGL61 [Eucalyptus grandis]